ncbi:MAG: dTDP-4-dehydrorhamnose reductase [Candidatus Saganbacteria bacterium]|nr:dTDP-4-dehydrorhamnose reductase [Candidatus Saganbacteria bacterium]
MKIAIIGADGQLGTDLCRVVPKEEQIPLTIKDLDITNPSQIDQVFKKYSPNIVINTAAYHKVDDCEDNPKLADLVNAIAVKNLAMACKRTQITLLHISTDYVFDGNKGAPYSEDDLPNPKTVYGASKLAGEKFAAEILPEHFIVRTCGLYGEAGCLGKGGTNFIKGMLRREKNKEKIRVVTDEIITPTYTLDLANKLYQLIQTKHFGLYHISNNGQCSWWEFASKIFEILKIDIKVEKATSVDFKTKAHRPKYSVLDNARLRKIGLKDMRNWDEALKDYLASVVL